MRRQYRLHKKLHCMLDTNKKEPLYYLFFLEEMCNCELQNAQIAHWNSFCAHAVDSRLISATCLKRANIVKGTFFKAQTIEILTYSHSWLLLLHIQFAHFLCVCFLFVSSLVPHTKNGNMLNYYLDGMTGKRGEKWRKQEEEEEDGKKHKHSWTLLWMYIQMKSVTIKNRTYSEMTNN